MSKINLSLWLVKGHYFVYSGPAGIISFYMTMTKQFGASEAIMGIMYSTLPFFFLFVKPFFGSLADKFQKKKFVLLASIITMYIGIFGTYFIPLDLHVITLSQTAQVTCDGSMGLTFPCHQIPSHTLSKISSLSCNFSCPISQNNTSIAICKNDQFLCPADNDSFIVQLRKFESQVSVVTPAESTTDVTNGSICQVQQKEIIQQLSGEDSCGNSSVALISCEINCTSNEILASSTSSSASTTVSNSKHWDENVYRLTPEIIIFWICTAISGIGMSVTSSVGDAVAIGLIKPGENFGQQKLWGSVSWGIVSIITGYLVDWVSEGKPYKDYTPGYCICLVAGIMHVLIVIFMKVEESEKPEALFKNVSGLFVRPHVIVFTLAIFLVGILTGPLWTFLLVYLDDLGASQLLIGLAVCIECFLGEIPCYFFADWLLRKISHSYTMVLVLAVLGLRMMVYWLTTDPWIALPGEATQGVTIGLFYAALATYPSLLATPSYHATLQGIFQGVFEGLGVGIGSLVSGILYQHYGGRIMFQISSITAFCFAILIASLLLALRYISPNNGSDVILQVESVNDEGKEVHQGSKLLPKCNSQTDAVSSLTTTVV